MHKYLQAIKDKGITPDLLQDIIADHKDTRERMKKLYERYKASQEGVPIFKRSITSFEDFKLENMKRLDNKVNNTLNNAFDCEIVDTKIGYFLGHPILYDFDDKREPGETSPIKDNIDTFNTRNHVEDEDAELGKMATICGYGARLAYVDREGDERVKNLDPWQVIFIGDDIHEPDYSIWYYEGVDGERKAEFYDDEHIHFFSAKEDKYKLEDKKEHLFDFNPLFGLANNKEMQGDAEKVLMLIDAYDRTLSDASNEIEQYRLAYLVLKGMVADDDVDMRHKKVIELLGEHDDVSYLTKDINDALIEHHLDRLGANIIRFAKSVDFTDEQFSGNITGVALDHKLRPLETKCITMERKFTAMLRYQYKVIFSAWSKKESLGKDDYLKVFFTFKRNNPINVLEESQAAQNLEGIVSKKTQISTLSFVDDPDYEIEQLEQEQDEFMKNMPDIGDDIESFGNKKGGTGTSSQSTSKKKNTCTACGGSGKATSNKTGKLIICIKCGGDGVAS